MKHLITTTEVWRVDTERDVENIIKENKEANGFDLTSYKSEYKCSKLKGEIVDEWYRVTLVKTFNNEKDPEEDGFEIIYSQHQE